MYSKFTSSLFGFSCLLVASACERFALPEEGNSRHSSERNLWNWTKAPDTSVVNYSKVFDVEIMRRCWLRQAAYDCLNISRTGDFYQAQRYQMPKLNRGPDDAPSQNHELRGYSCSFIRSGSVEEAIAGTGDFLAKNTVALYGQFRSQPWTAEYVAKFMRDNGIDQPRSHFDCTELAGQVLNSSVETVGSTTISYLQLMK